MYFVIMTWVETAPVGAVPCGTGALTIHAGSEALAVTLAKLGASAYVTAQVSGVVTAAVRTNPALAALVRDLPSPEVVYVLGKPAELPEGHWRIPFEAFAVRRLPEKN